MATATFVRTLSLEEKSTALIEVDGVEVVVDFWVELIDQWGKEAVKQYLCAEALRKVGFLTDAHELLQADAKGKLTVDTEGVVTEDTRNWQQNWLDSYPLPVKIVDPLA